MARALHFSLVFSLGCAASSGTSRGLDSYPPELLEEKDVVMTSVGDWQQGDATADNVRVAYEAFAAATTHAEQRQRLLPNLEAMSRAVQICDVEPVGDLRDECFLDRLHEEKALIIARRVAEQTTASTALVGAAPAADILGLEQAIASGTCPEYADFRDKLASARSFDHQALADVVRNGALGNAPAAEWNVLARQYVAQCHANDASMLGDLDALESTALAVDERLVDLALAQKRCGVLTSLEAGDRWPYEFTFAVQLQARDFVGAEVTRVLWRETLMQYLADCSANVSRRQRVATQARLTRLDRIVGLDDEILIDLRGKMLTALEKGNSTAVMEYSRAITDREKALDSRNAAVYDAKFAAIAAVVSEQAEQLKQVKGLAASASAAAAAATTTAAPAVGGRSGNESDEIAATAENIAKTAKSVHETAKTAKALGKMFGL